MELRKAWITITWGSIMNNNYKNILETLVVINKKSKKAQYLALINTICNLLNEEEEKRFNTAEYIREFTCGRLTVNVRFKSTHKVHND